MNIDLVYLWCDGSQPKMREKRLDVSDLDNLSPIGMLYAGAWAG